MLRKEIEAQGLANLYETIDLPLAPVLASMERHRVRLDRDALATMSATMEREMRALEKTLWDLAASKFNINSPLQLTEIIFDKLNLGTGEKRHSRPPCTA